jgi:hypothetical protein
MCGVPHHGPPQAGEAVVAGADVRVLVRRTAAVRAAHAAAVLEGVAPEATVLVLGRPERSTPHPHTAQGSGACARGCPCAAAGKAPFGTSAGAPVPARPHLRTRLARLTASYCGAYAAEGAQASSSLRGAGVGRERQAWRHVPGWLASPGSTTRTPRTRSSIGLAGHSCGFEAGHRSYGASASCAAGRAGKGAPASPALQRAVVLLALGAAAGGIAKLAPPAHHSTIIRHELPGGWWQAAAVSAYG